MQYVHLPDRAAAAEATSLIATFGEQAIGEAKARADLSRDKGNLIEFCRWRQIGRLVRLLGAERGEAALH